MAKKIQQAISIVQEAKEELNLALKAPEHVHNLLPINNLFDRILTRLQYMGGVLEHDQDGKIEFPPITNFMGEEIVPAAKITSADLTPKEVEKKNYIDKVEKLYVEFETIAPEGILNSYTNAEDILVLRGVAKKAGVEDYEDREINLMFLEKIASAIKLKDNEKKLQNKIDKDLAGQGKNDGLVWSKDVADDMLPYKITEEDILKNPSFTEAGIKAGDTVGIPKPKAGGKKGKEI